MPPKRKRAEDAAAAEDSAAPRATRRSTRNSTADSTASAATAKPPAPKKAPAKKVAKKAADPTDSDEAEVPPPKKTRTTKGPATKAAPAKTKKASAKKPTVPTESANDAYGANDDEDAGPSKSAKTAQVAPSPGLQYEAYTPQHAKALFDAYADAEEPDVIDAEGFMKLCADLGMQMEGALPLILAWHLQCKEMAKISREEWTKGMQSLQTASLPQLAIALKDLEQLLVQGNTSKETQGNGKNEPYTKAVYHTYAADRQKSFRSMYNFCYVLAKPPQSKNIDMETACAMWSVLLVPQYPHMEKIVDFTNERLQTHRAANKDLWQMMLEFCETVNPSLDNYEADGAWPTLLDEYVEWARSEQGKEQ